MGPETACETEGPSQGMCITNDPAFYVGVKANRVYPTTVTDLRRRRKQLHDAQRVVSQKLEVLNSLIALWED